MNVEASPSMETMADERLEGAGSFLMAATVFLRLIQSEARLMSQVIPPTHHKTVLDDLTKQPIVFFMRDGEVGVV